MIDTHLHVADPDVARYPRSSERLPTSTWWEDQGRDAHTLAADLEAAGVDCGVLVQAVGLYGYDNRYVLDAGVSEGSRFCALPALDPGHPGALGEIADLSQRQGVVGIRLFALGGVHPWVGTPRAGQALEAVGAAGLVAVVTGLGEHLEALLPAIRAHTEVPIVIDHCAFPAFDASGLVSGHPLLHLVPSEHVSIKVTSHLFEDARAAGADPADVVSDLVARFGGDRVMWGSDHPQTRLGDYARHVELARSSVRLLPAREAAAVLGSTAGRIFGL